MLPTVLKVEDVQRLRDGGSLAARFESYDGGRYMLFFPIRLDDHARMDLRLAHHDSPVLIDCDPAKRPPNTDKVF